MSNKKKFYKDGLGDQIYVTAEFVTRPSSRKGGWKVGMVSAFDEAQALGRTVQESESTFPSGEGWTHSQIAITKIPELVLEYAYINNCLKKSLRPNLPFLQLYSIGSYAYPPPGEKNYLSYNPNWVLSSSLDEAIIAIEAKVRT